MAKGKRPVLLIVQGAPGAGKTTLARRLAEDLHITQLGKDDLKEFLFDTLGTGDRQWSRMLGAAVSRMLYPFADAVLESERSLMLESAFYQEFAANELATIVAKRNARCLEIYCHLDPEERQRRFMARSVSGQRHAGHLDAESSTQVADAEASNIYAPLQIGEIYDIDTTHFGEPEYKALLRHVVAFIDD